MTTAREPPIYILLSKSLTGSFLMKNYASRENCDSRAWWISTLNYSTGFAWNSVGAVRLGFTIQKPFWSFLFLFIFQNRFQNWNKMQDRQNLTALEKLSYIKSAQHSTSLSLSLSLSLSFYLFLFQSHNLTLLLTFSFCLFPFPKLSFC